MSVLCLVDRSPGFKNTFTKEASKLGVYVEHSSAYNPSSQSAVEKRVGNLKHLLKRCGLMKQSYPARFDREPICTFSQKGRENLRDSKLPSSHTEDRVCYPVRVTIQISRGITHHVIPPLGPHGITHCVIAPLGPLTQHVPLCIVTLYSGNYSVLHHQVPTQVLCGITYSRYPNNIHFPMYDCQIEI